MNLFICNKKFDEIKKVEKITNHKYAPYSTLKKAKRHIYFNDIKIDFAEDINAFGFSPFIQSNHHIPNNLFFRHL